MIILHNDRIRSGCRQKDCMPMGDKYHSYYDWCIHQMAKVIEKHKGPLNVVVVSGTMDGISSRMYSSIYIYLYTI